MDKIIQEIVEIDRQCSKRVDEAKRKKVDVQANMNAHKKEIYDEFMKEQEQVIAEHKHALQEKIDQTKAQNETAYHQAIQTLQNLYESHKDEWVETIVARCLKG